MDKLDLIKSDRTYYTPGREPVEAAFGPLPYLQIGGRGAPGGPAYAEALEALFPLAYAVKFLTKESGRDFTVAKLEGQWWWPDAWAGKGPEEVPRDVWEWTLRLRQPGFVDAATVEAARARVAAKKDRPDRWAEVAFELWDEGPCVQALHLGPYATEPETLGRIHAHMAARGLVMGGHHHEIYLTDPRKGDPAKAKTILRIPVRRG